MHSPHYESDHIEFGVIKVRESIFLGDFSVVDVT